MPVADDISELPDSERGDVAYLTGAGSKPEGIWRYNGVNWVSGAQTNRLSLGRGVEGLSNNSNRRISNIEIPDDEQFIVWSAQISESSGATNGALLQVQDVPSGDVIFELDAGVDGITVQVGEPLFEFDGTGDEIRVRLRNETGGSTGLTGFINFSVE